jgi:glycosyltransferase involved in cell wall biosynthesis
MEARDRQWISLLHQDGIPVHFLPAPEAIAKSIDAMVAISRSENAAILHTHFSRQYEVETAFARLRSARAGMKLIWHRHSAGPSQKRAATRVKDLIANRLLAPDVTVLAVSDELSEIAIASGIAESQVRVVKNGIDIERATSASTSRADMRTRWNLNQGVFTFLHFGGDPVTKGVDLLLRAGAQADAHGLCFAVVIVGGNRTMESVRAIFGDEMPDWLRVVQPTECVADFYAAADCMLSSSRWEGFAYAVAEAMAAGLPVITTDVPGLRWTAASSGVMLVPLEPSSLASAMVAMIHSTQRPACAQANRQLISQSYSVDGWASGVTRIYTELVGDVTKRRFA